MCEKRRCLSERLTSYGNIVDDVVGDVHPCTPYRRGALSSRISVRFVEPAVGTRPVERVSTFMWCWPASHGFQAGRAGALIRLQAGDVVLVSRVIAHGISDSPGTALRDVPIERARLLVR